MVLIIDDLRHLKSEVVSQFNAEEKTVLIARNSRTGIAELEENINTHYAAIFLDHDLGLVDEKVDSILPVIDYLCEKAFNETPINVDVIYVHTSNPVGGKQMMASLQRYGYNVQRISPQKIFTA